MKKRLLIAGIFIFSGTALASSQLPQVKLVGKKKEIVYYYTLTVERNGLKAEFPIVRIGDTYYGLPMKLVNGQFVKVEPKVTLVPIKADFLKEAEKKLKEADLSFTIKGEGKGKLYVVFDAFCPFCMKAAQSGKIDKLKKKYAEIVFLPLAVHGEVSVKGLSCIYDKAKKEGVGKAVKEIFSWKEDKSWKEYEGRVEKCRYSKEIEEAVRKVSELLEENGVYATPTFFYCTSDKCYERVGKPDFSGVEK